MSTPSPPGKKALGPRLPPDDENWFINVDGFLGRNWYASVFLALFPWLIRIRDAIITNTKEVRFVRTFEDTLAYLSDAGVGDVEFWVVNGHPEIHESR
jgi:hypothetical protein